MKKLAIAAVALLGSAAIFPALAQVSSDAGGTSSASVSSSASTANSMSSAGQNTSTAGSAASGGMSDQATSMSFDPNVLQNEQPSIFFDQSASDSSTTSVSGGTDQTMSSDTSSQAPVERGGTRGQQAPGVLQQSEMDQGSVTNPGSTSTSPARGASTMQINTDTTAPSTVAAPSADTSSASSRRTTTIPTALPNTGLGGMAR